MFRKCYERIKRNISFAKSKRDFLYDKEFILSLNNNLAKDIACIMPLSSVQFFLNNAPFLIVHLVCLTISHFIWLCVIVATMWLHFVCRGVLLHYQGEGDRKRTRSGDSEFLFFLHLSASLSDRSRKVGTKNRQLPNERQLSGDQLQKGPDRRIRCNRPMSTVQHLCPFSVSFSSRSPRNFSRSAKGKETQRKGRGKGRSACLVRRTRH